MHLISYTIHTLLSEKIGPLCSLGNLPKTEKLILDSPPTPMYSMRRMFGCSLNYSLLKNIF